MKAKPKPKRVKPFVKLWVDGDECHSKRPSAGYDYIEFRVRQDQVPALIEQMAKTYLDETGICEEGSDYYKVLIKDVERKMCLALKRVGITAGGKA